MLAVAVVAVGCRSSTPEAAPPTTLETTPGTLPPTSTTVRATTTSSGPPRTTVTTVLALGPGEASLVGTVSGPGGPVDGATVRVERLVGKAVASTDVTTAGGGAWQLPSILGGPYRVRAFKTPDLAQSQYEAFFLAANERKTIDFKLAAAGGERITAVVTPNPPRVDQSATLTVTVGVGRVDEQGRPVLTPRPGILLTLSPGPGHVLESSPQVMTDASGAGVWRLRCVVEGASSVSLMVGPGVTKVNLPACGPPAATPTTRPA